MVIFHSFLYVYQRYVGKHPPGGSFSERETDGIATGFSHLELIMIFAKTRQHAKPILIMLLFYMGVCIWSIYVYICIYIWYIYNVYHVYICVCVCACIYWWHIFTDCVYYYQNSYPMNLIPSVSNLVLSGLVQSNPPIFPSMWFNLRSTPTAFSRDPLGLCSADP